MDALQSYEWPGNIRELQNVIERAVILSTNGVLCNSLPQPAERIAVLKDVWSFPAVLPNDVVPSATLKDSERNLIMQTLDAVGWVVGGPRGAAVKLGMKRTTLLHRMKKHGISRPAGESPEDVLQDAQPQPDSISLPVQPAPAD
jgi:transcriptional regulator with GAF, ATPase, and Fis domain